MISADHLAFDKNHIWHPYTSLTTPLPCYPVKSAEGVFLELEDGRKLVDGMSSWWACIHGYNVPQINDALRDQLTRTAHVMFGGITHQPAIDLCRRLTNITPQGLDRVFLCDSGSVSVEVALKMALQYWQSRQERRSRFLTIRHGYHGDTFGAMSVCDPEGGMHSLYSGFLSEQLFAPAPANGFDRQWHEDDITPLHNLLEENRQDVAAVILEPIVQGAGGMRIYSPRYLQRVRELCSHYTVLLIADEIATGFGRTGKLFACEHADISPDIMCLGKALTGGYMTLAATLTTKHVAETICSGRPGVFMHGPTFMGNPLACSAANASIEMLLSSDWQKKVLDIEEQLRSELEPCRDLTSVADVRVLGAIGVIECVEPVNVARMQRKFVDRGVWIRPFGKLVYIMPPYIIKADQLGLLTHTIHSVLQKGI